jgi:hypothetical protein
MNRSLITISLLFVLTAWIMGCVEDGQQAPITSHGGPVEDYVSLVDNLRASSLTVEPAGEISQPFFSVEGQLITVNGSDTVQVFEYTDAAAADAEASQVAPDGLSVGTTSILWVATPHFYKKGKLIVLYVGDNTIVTDALTSLLGPQFAGG